MANILGLGLRAAEFFWTLLIMALVGNMIHEAVGGNPSIVNYVMFTAIISMASLFYLIAATVSEGFAIHGLLPVLVDAFNVLFTFIAGVALAAYLGANNCSDSNYVDTNFVTNGSSVSNMKRCREAQASTAFLWFLFACYVASLVFSFLGRGSVGGGFNMRVGSGGIRRGPSMSQTSRA